LLIFKSQAQSDFLPRQVALWRIKIHRLQMDGLNRTTMERFFKRGAASMGHMQFQLSFEM
jgi:hypothetical protein